MFLVNVAASRKRPNTKVETLFRRSTKMFGREDLKLAPNWNVIGRLNQDQRCHQNDYISGADVINKF